MSLGLPSHLAARATSFSFVRGLQAIGLTCLVAAFLAAAIFQFASPTKIFWPALLVVLPMVVLLWLHRRTRSLFSALAFLSLGVLCSFWYIATFYAQAQPIVASDAFSVDFPLLALVMVGGPGSGPLTRFGWCAAGYVAAEIAGNSALIWSGIRPALHATTAISFGVIALFLVLTWAGQRRARGAQQLLHTAARDEQLAAVRHRIESRAAALMHDTVLNHLAAIMHSSDDELGEQLSAQIAHDLELLTGEEALDELSEGSTVWDWETSGVCNAIAEMRSLGLDVESTGDLAAVSRLSEESSVALGLAVKQCLVNVFNHASTDQAEVAVFGSAGEVSVMVIDAGRGFAVAETGPDRLGLRASVRRRMEAIGGSVQVWSTPGRGTSIMISVPAVSRTRDGQPPATERRPAEAVERTRQQRDPVGTAAVRIFTCMVVTGAASVALVSSLLALGEVASPHLALLAVVLLAASVCLVFRQTSPYRTPLGRGTYLLVIGSTVIAYFVWIGATIGHNRFGRDDWGPPVLGLILLAFGPYRPAREIAVTGAALATFVGLGTIIQVPWFATGAPPEAFVIVAVTPLVALCLGAVAYSNAMVSSIERWQRRSGSVMRGGGASVAIARSVRQDRVTVLGRDVLPFFAGVMASGSITDADRARAREIAVAVRDVMLAEADRSWLETAVMVAGVSESAAAAASIDDPSRLASGMSASQRMAIRTLIGAFRQEPGFEPGTLRIELSRDGDLCAADVSAAFPAMTGSPRSAFAPYLALLRSVFDDFQADFTDPALRVKFHYEQH